MPTQPTTNIGKVEEHTAQSLPHEPIITNNLEGWEERFDRELNFGRKGYHSLEEGEDFYYRVIKFIKNLRKKDMEELIKMLPDERSGVWGNAEFVRGYNNCVREFKQLIQDYYNK